MRLHRLGEGGQGVGEPGAVGRGRRREAAPRAVVGVGRDDAARLVPDGGEAEGVSRSSASRK